MASVKDTASFFANGNSKQFEYCLKLYPQVLRIKADKKCKKPDELVRLDDWYQNELPKKIKQRGKDTYIDHEELVQTMKWKQTRGKFYPQLSYLIKVNTPRAVIAETKKAFKKLPNLELAISTLSNLKGVGTTMASAIVAAAAPDIAPFMADECLLAIPEIEGIEYTCKEYMNFAQHIERAVTRLNAEKDSSGMFSPHSVELSLWTHYVASELAPELLDDLPGGSHIQSKNNSTNGVRPANDDDTIEDNSISNDSSSQDRTDNTQTTNTDDGTGNASPPPTTQIESPSDESNPEAISSTAPINGSNGNGIDENSLDTEEESIRSEDSSSNVQNSAEVTSTVGFASLKRARPLIVDENTEDYTEDDTEDDHDAPESKKPKEREEETD